LFDRKPQAEQPRYAQGPRTGRRRRAVGTTWTGLSVGGGASSSGRARRRADPHSRRRRDGGPPLARENIETRIQLD